MSNRFWRSVGIAVLPEFVKGPIRKRLHGYKRSARPFNLSLSPMSDGSSLAHLDDSVTVKILPESKAGFDYQCVDNADTIDEMRAFIDVSRDCRILFDVGAACGLFSLVFCSLSKEKRSVAFEPSPQMSCALERSIVANDMGQQIALEEVAVSDSDGNMQLALETSGYVQVIPITDHSQQVSVNATSLDSYARKHDCLPDLIKIDVEGFESEVLQGTISILERAQPIICLELHLNYLEQRGIPPRSVLHLLQSKGYEFFDCLHRRTSAQQIFDSVKPVVRCIARPVGALPRGRDTLL